MTKFNIDQENDLIAAGTHFWCRICCTARPVSEQVKPDRCRSCDFSLKHESMETPVNHHQTPQVENLDDLPVDVGKYEVENVQGVLL